MKSKSISKMKTINKSLMLSLALASMFMASCTQTGNNSTQTNNQERPSQNQQEVFNQAKAVFYSLPSPVETAATLESLGVKFNGEILHNAASVDKYNTTTAQAMNLGIYSADLSFCALYEQNQSVIDYLASVKKLAEQLGIVGFFNDSTISTIQENINNKNKIVGIVTNSYNRSTNFLEEQERSEIASTVIVGGWLESMYITIKMLNDVDYNKHKDEIREIVVNQEYTLEDLLGMLALFHDDNNIAKMETTMKELKTKFDKMGDNITPESIKEIEAAVEEIRAGLIQ